MERFDQGKATIQGASHNENIFRIVPEKISEYFIASQPRNLVE